MNDQDSAPAPEHREFYDERRESEHTTATQGGLPPSQQEAESAAPPRTAAGAESKDAAVPKVSTQDGGAKRDSFFRKRDYE